MQEPDNGYSIVEDLNPESAPDEHRLRWREFILGLILVLGVLGWVGWQWWQTQYTQTNYRLAQEATAQQDWDQALARYSAAQGYKDADARRAEAAKQVSERDSLYKTAVASKEHGDWAASLQASRAIDHIQPHFKDTKSLSAEAEKQVYRDALLGAVAKRPNADPPGLYYRDENSWVWLEGSDRDSVVRSQRGDGCYVYDVPGPNFTPAPNDNPGPYQVRSPGLQKRRLMALTVDGSNNAFTPLALNSGSYDFYVCGQHGVWGLTNTSGRNSSFKGFRLFQDFYSDYQSLDSLITSTVPLPGPEWAILDLSRDGSRLLLTEVYDQDTYDPYTYVYVANGDGSDQRLIYEDYVRLGSGQLSPDGKYALLKTFGFTDDYEKHVDSVTLVDLSKDEPKLEVLTTMFNVVGLEHRYVPGATFLTKGTHAGNILLVDGDVDDGKARILDPMDLSHPIAEAEYSFTGRGFVWVLEWEKNGGEVALIRQDTQEGTLSILSILSANTTMSAELPIALSRGSTTPSTTEDYLLYWSDLDATDDKISTLYSVAISNLGETSVRANNVYTDTSESTTPGPLHTIGLYTGPRLFAYTNKGQLHARTYDGKIDLPLETGVTDFYFDLYGFLRWLQ